ncbi:MAG: redoxin domain-containing protein, partial [bacterium]
MIPNARLEDQCGEGVDLWDFYGSYLVLDSSQSDCGPCRSMAAGAEAFAEEMREAGIPVRLVTLMGNGLSDPYGTPEPALVQAWVDEYGLTEPVLRDTGWAYAYFAQYMP